MPFGNVSSSKWHYRGKHHHGRAWSCDLDSTPYWGATKILIDSSKFLLVSPSMLDHYWLCHCNWVFHWWWGGGKSESQKTHDEWTLQWESTGPKHQKSTTKKYNWGKMQRLFIRPWAAMQCDSCTIGDWWHIHKLAPAQQYTCFKLQFAMLKLTLLKFWGSHVLLNKKRKKRNL